MEIARQILCAATFRKCDSEGATSQTLAEMARLMVFGVVMCCYVLLWGYGIPNDLSLDSYPSLSFMLYWKTLEAIMQNERPSFALSYLLALQYQEFTSSTPNCSPVQSR